jgi:hypothetical protein
MTPTKRKNRKDSQPRRVGKGGLGVWIDLGIRSAAAPNGGQGGTNVTLKLGLLGRLCPPYDLRAETTY